MIKKSLALLLGIGLTAGLIVSAGTVFAAEKPAKKGWVGEVTEGDAVIYELKNADGWTAKWHSSDKDVAFVTKEGKVKGRAPGEAEISVELTKKGRSSVTLEGSIEVLPTIATLARTADEQAEDAKVVVRGFDWGPGVDQVVLTLPKRVDKIAKKDAVVETKGVIRTVKSVFLSDAEGNRIEDAQSKYVSVMLETDSAVSGSPFDYDFETTFMNSWTPDYPFSVRILTKRGEKRMTYGFSGNCGNKTNMISPDTADWKKLAAYTGTYENPITKQQETVTLQRAAYEPVSLLGDSVKNPLVIWLHGQGEGGTDPDVAILGNKVSALTKDVIQTHFTTTNGAQGAYVFIAQTPTYWMDEGNGLNGAGDNPSRYTEALMDAIRTYLAENPDVDTDRIYLTGCSNGGYMTMNMLIRYPDFFAAAIPNCEAYAFNKVSTTGNGSAMGGTNQTTSTDTRWLTDKKIKKLKDIPIWFLASADDSIVTPSAFELPAYQALLQAGADNTWFSYYDQVRMKDDPAAEVMGHWVWVYFFNDEATGVQDPAVIKASTDPVNFGFVPTAGTGGSLKATVNGRVYEDCYDWLNSQNLQERIAKQAAEKAAKQQAAAEKKQAEEEQKKSDGQSTEDKKATDNKKSSDNKQNTDTTDNADGTQATGNTDNQ